MARHGVIVAIGSISYVVIALAKEVERIAPINIALINTKNKNNFFSNETEKVRE